MNTEENVVKMPGPLERRAQRIEAAMERRDRSDNDRARSDKDWREATLELAIELAGARADHGNNDRAFGEWLESRFGPRAPAATNRAILIRWGNDPDQARAVLEKTDSRHLQGIDRMFPRARIDRPAAPPKRPRRSNKVEAAAEALKTETGEWPDQKTLATVAGVHSRNAANALRTVKAVEEATGAEAEVKYTKAQDHHVEARIRAATKELERAAAARETSFWECVTKEANASCEKRFPNLQERENDVVRAERHWRTVANNHKPILNETEFGIIRFCLHPDNSASKEKRENAFAIFNLKKLQLTGKK